MGRDLYQILFGGSRLDVGNNELERSPHIDIHGQSHVAKAFFPIQFARAVNGRIVELIQALVPRPDRTTTFALRTTDVNVLDRYMGELLLQDDPIVVDTGAPVPGAAFNTRGFQHIFVTVLNPPWATNPTALTVGCEVSTDAFDTEAFNIIALDGIVLEQTLSFADNQMSAFFMPTMLNAAVLAATNVGASLPIPDIDGMTIRLVFTPAGAGITAEAMNVNVYGITSR